MGEELTSSTNGRRAYINQSEAAEERQEGSSSSSSRLRCPRYAAASERHEGSSRRRNFLTCCLCSVDVGTPSSAEVRSSFSFNSNRFYSEIHDLKITLKMSLSAIKTCENLIASEENPSKKWPGEVDKDPGTKKGKNLIMTTSK